MLKVYAIVPGNDNIVLATWYLYGIVHLHFSARHIMLARQSYNHFGPHNIYIGMFVFIFLIYCCMRI